jgi:hypothetical protein
MGVLDVNLDPFTRNRVSIHRAGRTLWIIGTFYEKDSRDGSKVVHGVRRMTCDNSTPAATYRVFKPIW